MEVSRVLSNKDEYIDLVRKVKYEAAKVRFNMARNLWVNSKFLDVCEVVVLSL